MRPQAPMLAALAVAPLLPPRFPPRLPLLLPPQALSLQYQLRPPL